MKHFKINKAVIAPTPGDVNVNMALSNMSLAFMQGMEGFVADQVFPNIPVDFQSGVYWVWPRDSWNRDEMKERAPGAESAGSNFGLTRAGYYAPVQAIHSDIEDQVLANANRGVAYEMAKTRYVTMKGMIRRESTFVTNYMAARKWTSSLVGASSRTAAGSMNPSDATDANNHVLYWSDPASTPIEDLRYGIRYVQLVGGGFRPNTLTLPRQVADVLYDHPEIIARVNAGQTPGGPAVSSNDIIARILGLKRVLVMDGVVNAAAEGQTEANAFFGGKNALLTYSPDAPNEMEASAGYTFSWNGYLGATPNGTRIKRWYSNDRSATRVEAEVAYQQAVTSVDLGLFFNGIIA